MDRAIFEDLRLRGHGQGLQNVSSRTSGGFRGGDGGDASPPTSLKVTILAEKSALILNNSAPFRDASPPTDLNVTNPAEKSVLILVKTFFFFFFFFFWRPPDFGQKKTFEFPISAEKSVSILVKTSEFLRFWLQIPPHQNFLDPPLSRTPPLLKCISQLHFYWDY